MASLLGAKTIISLLKTWLVSEYVIMWEGEDICRESHWSFVITASVTKPSSVLQRYTEYSVVASA